jgi:hypothetical protein
MGSFPFASTVGSMWNSYAEPVNARLARNPREAWRTAWCWHPNGTDKFHRTTTRSSSFASHTPISASCLDTAQCRGDRSTGERSPP